MKPRLRGVLHQYAFFVSLASGTLLVLLAATTKAAVAVAIYAASTSALFGVSALYHRVTWTPPARHRMRRLDHAMIFLLIAGTYTPVGLLVLHGTLGTVVLVVVWVGRWPGSRSNWPGRGRPDGWGGPCTWRLAGSRWWPCRSCSPGSASPAGGGSAGGQREQADGQESGRQPP
jgi:predicted membrane channel-forming protein YqfA (hemolysin III family)